MVFVWWRCCPRGLFGVVRGCRRYTTRPRFDMGVINGPLQAMYMGRLGQQAPLPPGVFVFTPASRARFARATTAHTEVFIEKWRKRAVALHHRNTAALQGRDRCASLDLVRRVICGKIGEPKPYAHLNSIACVWWYFMLCSASSLLCRLLLCGVIIRRHDDLGPRLLPIGY